MLTTILTTSLAVLLLAAVPAWTQNLAPDCDPHSPRGGALCQRLQEFHAQKARLDRQSETDRAARLAEIQQRGAPIRAKLEAMRKASEHKLATMPLDEHTVTHTWTDHRGRTQRTETTCTFYQSKTECHSR
jgi:hypothetical protein